MVKGNRWPVDDGSAKTSSSAWKQIFQKDHDWGVQQKVAWEMLTPGCSWRRLKCWPGSREKEPRSGSGRWGEGAWIRLPGPGPPCAGTLGNRVIFGHGQPFFCLLEVRPNWQEWR